MEKDFKTVSKLLFPDKEEFDKTPSRRFEDELRNQYHKLQRLKSYGIDYSENEDLVDEKYKSIADYIKDHVKAVGKEQAVRDFQCGLNFLHKGLKEALKEDGDFGEKTFKAFYEIFKHYDIEIIKNAIRKGALSNTVIGTASDKTLNTQTLVNQVQTNLGGIN